MPQLNPSPWFGILVFSWFIFLTIIPLKIMSHLPPNEAISQDTLLFITEAWSWPWY
uniref:ATP synthase complex subunit 8 n=1 Tax=Macrognathus pancalus TaxID=497983 RepID=A0A1J0MRR7_9TELE|nr:ATP synthase F0 subunit 8 [Macrognathus pancalus]APD28176.1 ATP synthase F0 subunit 8 [Macrognathus pancalus]